MFSNNKGLVLPLLALLLIPIILLLALAIDTARLSITQSEQRSVAEMLCLSALEQYQSTAGTHATRFQSGIDRAADLIREEDNALLGQWLQTQWTLLTDPFAVPAFSHPGAGMTSPVGDWGELGTFEPGTFWWDPPGVPTDPNNCNDFIATNPGADPFCPCPEVVSAPGTYAWEGECFQRTASTENVASAVRVRLHTHDNSPVNVIFGTGYNQQQMTIAAEATCALIPRKGVYAVDLSASTITDTHLAFVAQHPSQEDSESWQYGAHASLALSDPVCNPGDPTINPCLNTDCNFDTPIYGATYENITQPCKDPYSQMIIPIDPPAPPYVEYFDLCSVAPRAVDGYTNIPAAPIPNNTGTGPGGVMRSQFFGSFFPPVKHFQDDYQCVIVNVGGADQHYLIDNYIGPVTRDLDMADAEGPEYIGEEPLTGILTGIHSGMEVMESRTIAGDEISIIGFDHQILAMRSIGPLNTSDPLFADVKDEIDVLELSIPAGPARRDAQRQNKIERAVNRFFISRTDRVDGGSLALAQTDLPGILMQANALLGGNVRETADRFVVLFTDGISSCSHGDDHPREVGVPGGSTGIRNVGYDFLDFTGPSPVMKTDICVTPGTIMNDGIYSGVFMNHLASMLESQALLNGNGPFAPFLTDGVNEQLSFADANIKLHLFLVGEAVRPHELLRKSESDPGRCMTSAEARALEYEMVEYVNPYGLLAVGTFNQMLSGNASRPYEASSYSWYKEGVWETGGLYQPARPPCEPGTQARLDAECGGSSVMPGEVVLLDSPGIADKGKVYCDPGERTIGEQATEFVQAIYGTSPFLLVETP